MAENYRVSPRWRRMRGFRAAVGGVLLLSIGWSAVHPVQARFVADSLINGPIVFARGNPLIETIWRMSPSGDNVRKISDRPDGSFSCPRATRDGRLLTFEAYSRNSDSEIYWSRIDGTDVQRVTRDGGDDFSPDWAPGGRRLVFSRLFGGADLFVVRRNGEGLRQVTNDGRYDTAASWSPGGGRLAYHSARVRRRERPDIFIVNLKSGNRRRLTHSIPRGAASVSPEWSPNGRRIVFARSNDGDSEIMVMRRDGSNKRKLTDNAVLDMQPSWSPDGKHIVFVRKVDEKFQIFRMRSDGTHVRRLSNGRRNDFCPDWIPKPS